MTNLPDTDTDPEAPTELTHRLEVWGAQAVLLVIGSYVIVTARGLGLWRPEGPGPGFFPLVLAMALIALSVTWFVQTRLTAGSDAPQDGGAQDSGAQDSGAEDSGAQDSGGGEGRRATVTVLSLVALTTTLNLLGFQVGMLLFLLFHLRVMGRCRWITSVIIALVGSVGAYHVFNDFLQVPLPKGAFPLLTWLGI